MSRGWLLGGGACVALAAPALVDPPHGARAPGQRADAALVLSGDVDFARLRRAVALRAAGEAPLLLLTGSGVGGDSAIELRRQALALGVPQGAIRVEERSRSTRENLVLAAPLLRAAGCRRVALVTSASHMARAELAARHALPDIEWLPEPVADPGPMRRVVATRVQEWAKLGWYLARGWI